MEGLEIILSFLSIITIIIILFYYIFRDKNGYPTNWPIVGMLPALLKNFHRINDYIIEVCEKDKLTFFFKGPWLSNMNILITLDPTNIHYVLIKNFNNYRKGSKFNEIFNEAFGEGVLNSDDRVWQHHRRIAQSSIAHPRFYPFLARRIWEKVEGGLIPVLDRVVELGLVVDLQDLFERLTMDTICAIVMDHDPRSLSTGLPRVPASEALTIAEEVVMRRLVMPTWAWKLQRWLGFGSERRHREAVETLDGFVYEHIAKRWGEMEKEECFSGKEGNVEGKGASILTLYMEGENGSNTKFLRDSVVAFLIAGRDTTSTALSWFFYLLSKNPEVLSRIREELDAAGVETRDVNGRELYDISRSFEEASDRLVYLHGALCETLRLYPPVLFEGKAPVEADVLPSGHRVYPNTQIAFNLYAMGRMRSIWGDDCLEFKPERWISEEGKIKHEASSKFMAFNAGPRLCLGKNMAMTQIKIVAVTIIQNYQIQPVEGHLVVPDFSIILHMKHGFKVRVAKSK